MSCWGVRQSELTEIRPEFALSHMVYEVSGAGLKTLMMTPLAPRYSECGNNKQCLSLSLSRWKILNVILFQQNWSGCPGRDMVVLLLKVHRFLRLFLLCAEKKVFSSLDPSRGSSRGSARCCLVWAKGEQKGMRLLYKIQINLTPTFQINKKLFPDISAIPATFLICLVPVCGGRTHNILRVPQLFRSRGHVQLLLPRRSDYQYDLLHKIFTWSRIQVL